MQRLCGRPLGAYGREPSVHEELDMRSEQYVGARLCKALETMLKVLDFILIF